MNQGQIYNQRKQQRELLSLAMQDYNGTLPSTLWYDQLRQTDDGRFNIQSEASLIDKENNFNSSNSKISHVKAREATIKCFGEAMKKRAMRMKSAAQTARSGGQHFNS